MKKICKNCQSNQIIKNGKRLGIQRLLCKNCGFVWELRKKLKHKQDDDFKLFHSYVMDEVKYRQLASIENTSIRDIQRRLDTVVFEKNL